MQILVKPGREKMILQLLNKQIPRYGIVTTMLGMLLSIGALSQETGVVTPVKKDSVIVPEKKVYINKYDSSIKAHSPKVAAIRSALLPGLGQIYNKKYWKLPIVYGAMGVTAGIFFYNLHYYNDTRFAYRVKYNMRVNKTDSLLYPKIKEELKPLDEESLRSYRNQFRRDIDYSVIFFLVFWGLNVVDATVDAHLKSFDVSPDLSLKIKPGYSGMAQTSGISFIFSLKDKHVK